MTVAVDWDVKRQTKTRQKYYMATRLYLFMLSLHEYEIRTGCTF